MKSCVLRACLNAGVVFMERLATGKLFQTVGPLKEIDLSPKVFLFVVGTRSVKLSEDERSGQEFVYLCSNCDRYLGPPSEREQ